MKLTRSYLRSFLFGSLLVVGGAVWSLTQFDGPDKLPPPAPLIVQLKSSLRRRNPAIEHVSVRDMRPLADGSPKHLVVARGLSDAPEARRTFEDELFGIFIFDAERGILEDTIEIIPTPRLMDAEMRIEKLLADECEVTGRSIDLGHVEWRRSYRFNDH